MQSHAGRPRLNGLLHPIRMQNLVRDWLLEDTPSFDYGGFVVGDTVEQAFIMCKSPGILAGTPFVEEIFRQLECDVEWFHEEGTRLEPICKVARVSGRVRNLLQGERVALNCMARTSGIATFARAMYDIAVNEKWHGEIAGTRKTTPGFRLPEKYALLVGGISTHRYDLSSMVMLKDNHIWTAGNVFRAVKDARSACGFSSKVEVECRSFDEASEAASAGADIVMLDNFEVKSLHHVAMMLKQKFPTLLIEASGGITVETLPRYFGENVDVISLSQTTQGYSAVDFSMKIDKRGRLLSNPAVRVDLKMVLSDSLIG